MRIIQYESDGWTIESILVLPLNYQSDKRYPTLIYLHGGPEDSIYASFTELVSARGMSAAHFLASHDYAIFIPNFRGGDGYGEAFQSEIGSYKSMEVPYRDAMSGLQLLIDDGITDPNGLGVYGTSFGAQLVTWMIGHTNRFKGAVASVGVHYDALFADRYSGGSFLTLNPSRKGNAEESDIWIRPELIRNISPIEHLGSIRTPTMLVETGGEREDGFSKALPFFNGLNSLGVESHLIYYPEAFHNGGWNDHYKKDYMLRLVAWFDLCIKGIQLPEWFYMNRKNAR